MESDLWRASGFESGLLETVPIDKLAFDAAALWPGSGLWLGPGLWSGALAYGKDRTDQLRGMTIDHTLNPDSAAGRR